MRARDVRDLDAGLDDRDRLILSSLERLRLLSSRHVQRLHFTDHASDRAAARACSRCLRRLHELGLVAPLVRRVGGVRKGSASYVWQLAATGERYLRVVRGEARRRRFVEPGHTFIAHTLAVNDVAVALLDAGRTVPGFTVETLGTEPGNWRSYLGPAGETRWLKPDLHVVTARVGEEDEAYGEYEEHVFLEIDLGTEHLPRIQAKCRMYADYAATGRYQAAHELFPEVIWLSADPAREAALSRAVAVTPYRTSGLAAGMFRVTSPAAYLAEIRAAAEPPRETPGPHRPKTPERKEEPHEP